MILNTAKYVAVDFVSIRNLDTMDLTTIDSLNFVSELK